MAAVRRLNKELRTFQGAAPGGASVELDGDNIYKWHITVPGPAGSCYEGGVFKIDIEYPPQYPLKAPEAHIKTKIYHPQVNEEDNHFCFALLADWAAATPTTAIIEDFISALQRPQDCNNPLNNEAFSLAKDNMDAFAAKARQYVNDYAK